MLSRPLVVFVRDLTHFAAFGADADARRALCSPFSGVPNVDARALAVAAGEKRSILETIKGERVALARESTLAARRFAAALDGLEKAFRAQGATLREHLATVGLGFDFDQSLDAAERATLDQLDELAVRLDADRPAGTAWEAPAFLRILEDVARANLAGSE